MLICDNFNYNVQRIMYKNWLTSIAKTMVNKKISVLDPKDRMKW